MDRDLLFRRLRIVVLVGDGHKQCQGRDSAVERPCRSSISLFRGISPRDLGCLGRLVLWHHPIVCNSPGENREATATIPGVRAIVGWGPGDSLRGILVLGQLAG